MKRFNAPNMDMMRGSDRGDPAGRLLYEDDDRAVVMVKVSLLVTWRFWKVAIARDLRRASAGRCSEYGNAVIVDTEEVFAAQDLRFEVLLFLVIIFVYPATYIT
jgi:hypothetical protein